MELIGLSTQYIPDLLKIEGKVFDPSWGVEAITQCFNADSLNVGVKYEDSEEHARLVGYLLASIKLDEIWILRIATDEVYRGLGCATYLLRHVFQYGRAHQMNRLTLEVRRIMMLLSLYMKNVALASMDAENDIIIVTGYMKMHY